MMNESFVVGPNEEAFEIEKDLFKCGVNMSLQLFESCGNNKITRLYIDLIHYLSYPLYCNLFYYQTE